MVAKTFLVFTLLCAILTLLLIYQELVTFAITKPTSSSREEKDFESRDLPDVVLCFDHGFDSKVLKKYGYSVSYYRLNGSGKWSLCGLEWW